MPSTNKTTNYELSQFVNTDVPSWLGDYNGDMQKIDGAIHSVSENADDALQVANSASETVNGVVPRVGALEGAIGGLDFVRYNTTVSTNIILESYPDHSAVVTASNNGKLAQISVYGTLKNYSAMQGVVVKNNNYYYPICSSNGNVFKTNIGSIATGNNVVYCGNGFMSIAVSQLTQRYTSIQKIYAVFNGVDTVFYAENLYDTTYLSVGNTFTLETTCLFTGTYGDI